MRWTGSERERAACRSLKAPKTNVPPVPNVSRRGEANAAVTPLNGLSEIVSVVYRREEPHSHRGGATERIRRTRPEGTSDGSTRASKPWVQPTLACLTQVHPQLKLGRTLRRVREWRQVGRDNRPPGTLRPDATSRSCRTAPPAAGATRFRLTCAAGRVGGGLFPAKATNPFPTDMDVESGLYLLWWPRRYASLQTATTRRRSLISSGGNRPAMTETAAASWRSGKRPLGQGREDLLR